MIKGKGLPKMGKRVFCVLLALMVLLLSACGPKETDVDLSQDSNMETIVVGGSDQGTSPIVVGSDSGDDIVLDGIPEEGSETAPPVMSHSEDYARYRELNEDVVGWISVPNTRIEYPIVHGSDNDYYLTRTVEGEESKAGSVFLDFRNADMASDKHIILYGHNMRNGTMFHDLQQYKREDFFQNNRDIKVYCGNTEMRFEIYAAYIVNIDNDFIKTGFSTDTQFLQYMNDYRGLSKFEPKPRVELTKDDQILTLATCTYEYDNSRFVVQARRVG